MLHKPKASELATGKWYSILVHFGIESSYLKNKHGPCPICGGKDRFRFDDKNGRGTWICSQACGAGDGFKLLELFKGWSFREAAHRVNEIVGGIESRKVKQTDDLEKRIESVKRIWNEAIQVTKGDPVWLYLNQRIGIDVIPKSLRYHPALSYVDGELVEYHPAMVAAVVDSEGVGIGVHRIYLDNEGNKANVSTPKKLLNCKPLAGGVIRLGGFVDHLGIAEGIETALAASRLFSIPTWAAISAGMMEKWTPPDNVRKVTVFGDNDISYTGQSSAYALAKRLTGKGIAVNVRIPESTGKDWVDEIK